MMLGQRKSAAPFFLVIGLSLFLYGCEGGGNGDERSTSLAPFTTSFFASPAPESIVTDAEGMRFPVNQLILDLVQRATRSDAERLARLVGFHRVEPSVPWRNSDKGSFGPHRHEKTCVFLTRLLQ